jgi:hypothetical protein
MAVGSTIHSTAVCTGSSEEELQIAGGRHVGRRTQRFVVSRRGTSTAVGSVGVRSVNRLAGPGHTGGRQCAFRDRLHQLAALLQQQRKALRKSVG